MSASKVHVIRVFPRRVGLIRESGKKTKNVVASTQQAKHSRTTDVSTKKRHKRHKYRGHQKGEEAKFKLYAIGRSQTSYTFRTKHISTTD